MKLLDKKTIEVQKSNERKREVEEGMKLARSVDTLRETHSKEQINLKKFRDATLKSIKEECNVLEVQKNALLNEITALEEKRLQAQQPLDLTIERKKVEIEKKEVFELKTDLLNRETALISREALVQNIDKREKQLLENEEKSKAYLDEIHKTYIKTEDLRRDMESRKTSSEVEINEKYEQLKIKENELVTREHDVITKLDLIEKDKKLILTQNDNLVEREITVEAKLKSLNERDELIREKELLTKRFNEEASHNYDVSDDIKQQTQQILEEAQIDIKTRYEKLTAREQEFGYKERDLILEKEQVENDKKNIEREKLHIASQQQTLKVAWENIKKLSSNKK